MIQELFSETLSIGRQAAVGAGAAAGFVSLLSLFNMGGRFCGRRFRQNRTQKHPHHLLRTRLAAVFRRSLHRRGRQQSPVHHRLCVITSMYGGGVAAIQTYLKDLFGTYQVGAIQERILLAWSTAAVIGPVLVSTDAKAKSTAA